MSTHRLFEHLEAFMHNVQFVKIPIGVQDVFRDPKWTQAIKDEMLTL